MANCCNCSAPLPRNSITCEYCGSRNDTDLKGVHEFTTQEAESKRMCPRCTTGLRTIDLKIGGTFLIERCDTCLGLFFDPGELEKVLETTVSNVFTIDRARLDVINDTCRTEEAGALYVKCPVCTKIMNRVNFGVKSGVIVHRCKDDGIWLDGGSLRHLFEWTKAGGSLLQKERDEQLKAEREREERQERVSTSPRSVNSYDDYIDGGFFGGNPASEAHVLCDVVKAAWRLFRG